MLKKYKLLQNTLLIFAGIITSLSLTPLRGETAELLEKLTVTSQPAALKRLNTKDWTFMVYMAANNNLHSFGIRNIHQMLQVGSNDNINILVQLDGLGAQQVKRYYIEKGRPVLITNLDHGPLSTSGTPRSLYEFVKWGVSNFPSRSTSLVLWNHGSGIKDPSIWGRILMAHRDELFTIDPATGLLTLNRKINEDNGGAFMATRSILDALLGFYKERGIAFNETHEEYINNTELKTTLNDLCTNVLGRKFDIIGMDACHMGMVEYAHKLKSVANYMVASPEVEPGAGWDYASVLSPFSTGSLTADRFASHIVDAYNRQYQSVTGEYTQSAVSLRLMDGIDPLFANLASTLTDIVTQRGGADILRSIRLLRSSFVATTEFFDSDYIDACHFLKSLINKLDSAQYDSKALSPDLAQKVSSALQTSRSLLDGLQRAIIRNAAGNTLPMSHGLALYFPKRSIHPSYYKTSFDRATGWSKFLAICIRK